jgi:hypothetical protein
MRKVNAFCHKQLIWEDGTLVLVIKFARKNTFTFDHPKKHTKNVVYVVTLSHGKESMDEETRGQLLSIPQCDMILGGVPPRHLLFPGLIPGLHYNLSFIH